MSPSCNSLSSPNKNKKLIWQVWILQRPISLLKIVEVLQTLQAQVGTLQAQNVVLQAQGMPSSAPHPAPHEPKYPFTDKLSGDCDKFCGFLLVLAPISVMPMVVSH